jgi:Ca2+-binding RTX toxin-like protein
MNLNVIYGQGADNNAAPSGFYEAVNYVVNYFDGLFSSNVTINIKVSYGAILNPYNNSYSPLASGDLGESYQNSESIYNYTAIRNALLSENAPGASTLPSTSPVPGSLYFGSAEAKALGLLGASSALDGSIGVASASPYTSWDYSATKTPTANQYYLIGVLEHEFSEVMGRISNLDTKSIYSVADLYRYSSSGARDLTAGGNGSVAYFSLDNGATNLGSWNNQISNGDLGDWYPQGPAPDGNDAFNDYSNSDVINSVSPTDITLMQALGWAAPVTTANVQNLIIYGQNGDDNLLGGFGNDSMYGADGNDTMSGGDGQDLIYGNFGFDVIYGNIGNDTIFGGQDNDLLFGGQGDDIVHGNLGNDVIYGNLGNDTIFGGQGDDVIYSGQGNDVISGGLGNDLLFGNLGADTFVADSGAGADTIGDFHSDQGDLVSLGGQSILSTSSNPGGDLVVTLSGGGTLTFAGIPQDQFSSSWFT